MIRVQSVIETLGERAVRHPERAALLFGEQRVSFAQLWSRVVAAACYLSDAGVRPGERVLIDAPSGPAFAYGYFATHLLGAVAVPLDLNAPLARREELIRRTRPALALLADTRAQAGAPCAVRPLAELEGLPARQRAFGRPELDATCDLIFTTGTTGRPKGVRLTHRNLATAASHINAVIGTTEEDVDVVPIPLCHAFGLGRMRCVLSAGGAVVLVQGFRLPGEILAALERHRATGLIGVPAGFALLLRFGERGLARFSDRLRYVEIGSAPMPVEHKRILIELLPRTRLFMHYGLTEAARSAFSEFHRDSARLETAGLPAPGVQIQARDDDRVPCPPGAAGMLWVGGKHVSPGYWDEAELSAATFVDGWMRTGDVGHVDEAGFVYLRGRIDDIVNVGGLKVWPEEVERVLCEHPGVSEAACIGVPDPRGIAGHVLRVFLVAAAGAAAIPHAELSRWAARRLEPYKVPSEFEWLAELPRTASGKLMRAALRGQDASRTQLRQGR